MSFATSSPRPDPGVVLRRHDVREADVDHHFDFDVRIGRQDLAHCRHEDRFSGVLRRGDPDRPGRLLAEFAQGPELDVHLVEFGPDLQQQPLAGLRRRDAAGRAVQQPDAQPLLQVLDDLTEGRLSDREPCRRPGEAALSRHRQEGEQVARVGAFHL